MNPSCFRTVLLFLLAACLFPAPGLRADTPMEKTFERLEKAYKKLGEGLKDPKEQDKEAYLKLAEEIKSESQKARDMEPKMTQSLPESERAAFLEKFRKDMDKFNTDVDTLITAVKGSQWEDARKAFETLRQAKRDGHKAYRKREEQK